jgi:hypothetical protein
MLRGEYGCWVADTLNDCKELGSLWFTEPNRFRCGSRRVLLTRKAQGPYGAELNLVYLRFSKIRKWRGDKRSNFPKKHRHE